MPSTNPAAMPQGPRAERKREAIVGAALEAFLDDGYGGTAMDAIADRAGVSKVTVYNHFGSKQDLFTAVIGQALDRALDGTLTEAQAHLASSDDVRDLLLSTARAWVRGVTTPDVLALRNLVTGELKRFPELGAAWRDRGPGRFFPVLTEVLEQLQEQGKLRVPDIEVAVIQLFALTLYPHFVFSSFGESFDPDLADRLLTEGVDTFLARYASVG